MCCPLCYSYIRGKRVSNGRSRPRLHQVASRVDSSIGRDPSGTERVLTVRHDTRAQVDNTFGTERVLTVRHDTRAQVDNTFLLHAALCKRFIKRLLVASSAVNRPGLQRRSHHYYCCSCVRPQQKIQDTLAYKKQRCTGGVLAQPGALACGDVPGNVLHQLERNYYYCCAPGLD